MSNWYRTATKGIVWELLGIIIMYLLTKQWKIVTIYFIIRIIMYYIYHRVWKLIKWGK